MASSFNHSTDSVSYIYLSTIKTINRVSDKIALSVYAIVLVLSIIQTFWKNKRVDRLLAYVNEAYSDGKFESSRVYFRGQIISCYRFDQHFSYVPHPSRSILFIIATHIQVLMLIVIRTLFTQQSEVVNDCYSFHYPYEILECEHNRDPCGLNDTDPAPKCTYYSFELTNFITMVTSVISWHYALRYLVIKLVRFIRWTLFRDDDQPRKMYCCCQTTPRILRCVMRFNYISLWLYIFSTVLFGFITNVSVSRIPSEILGSVWTPIAIAADRLYSLTSALTPELIQNWLDATSNGEVLQDFKSKGLILDNVEPLVYLTDKNTEMFTLTETKLSQNDIEVIVVPSNHTSSFSRKEANRTTEKKLRKV